MPYQQSGICRVSLSLDRKGFAFQCVPSEPGNGIEWNVRVSFNALVLALTLAAVVAAKILLLGWRWPW